MRNPNLTMPTMVVPATSHKRKELKPPVIPSESAQPYTLRDGQQGTYYGEPSGYDEHVANQQRLQDKPNKGKIGNWGTVK